MPNKVFPIGIVGGIAMTVALASLFSSQGATAQLMQQQQMQQSSSQHEMNHAMFNVNGMSMVQDVGITGVNITGDNQVSVNLIYTGNESSPSVTVVAMTNHMAMMMMMMNMMMGGYGGYSGGMMMGPGMMIGGGFPGMMMNPNMMMNNSGFPGMMMGPGQFTAAFQSQTGSTMVNSGWQSGSAINVVLEGDGSIYDASDLHVMIFPHLT